MKLRVSRDCERLGDQRAVERPAARDGKVGAGSIDHDIRGAGAADGDAVVAGVAAGDLHVERDVATDGGTSCVPLAS